MKRIIYLLLAAALTIGCSTKSTNNKLRESGVSLSLSEFRSANYKDVKYDISFNVPNKRDAKVTGRVNINFTLDREDDIIIDFRADSSQVLSLTINNKEAKYIFENEHIIIERENIQKGEQNIDIEFISNDQSLNRRDDLLYTLLVPDRARTLFPCFDQPNIKALCTLKLTIPNGWSAVSNSAEQSVSEDDDYTTIQFNESEPISTYLFAFVAGKMEREIYHRGDREISIYHRETDEKKRAQCPEIAGEVFDALEWVEEYTGIDYPFSKYDLIIVPDFQYGGMEHTGATLYKAASMFLNPNPTINERLSRSLLIAHETAHMWFGDYVTMDWFSGVWIKEVFANYFASQIVEPQFPQINHSLHFMLDYYPSSYSEDRTIGTNAIDQKLDNLNNAGLVYGQIIYNKSPIVMRNLIEYIGKDNFRAGIQQYLTKYGYSNAAWSDLITIFDNITGKDISSWSDVWVTKKGMPTIETYIEGDSLIVVQSDRFDRGICWNQTFKLSIDGKEYNVETISDTTKIAISSYGDIIPNIDGHGYGYFKIYNNSIDAIYNYLDSSTNEVNRGAILIMLNENLQHKNISPTLFCDRLSSYVSTEENSLLYSLALGYISGAVSKFEVDDIEKIEKRILPLTKTASITRNIQAFRTYTSISKSDVAIDYLYDIWLTNRSPKNLSLSESDYTNLSYKLALHREDKYDFIVSNQMERITNPDRKAAYKFISPSLSYDQNVRDSVFNSLLKPENRRIEPMASASLRFLNDKTRQTSAVKYILPALEKLEEVQRTGDIFFPTAWVSALLGGHHSSEAKEIVLEFIESNPNYSDMLHNKVMQQSIVNH